MVSLLDRDSNGIYSLHVVREYVRESLLTSLNETPIPALLKEKGKGKGKGRSSNLKNIKTEEVKEESHKHVSMYTIFYKTMSNIYNR